MGNCARSLQSLDPVAQDRRVPRAKPVDAATAAKRPTGSICSIASTWRCDSTELEKTAVSTNSRRAKQMREEENISIEYPRPSINK